MPIPTNHLFNPSVKAFGTASGPRGPTHSQVSTGAPLVIIGIEVDPNHLTFTPPAASHNLLLSEIAKFCLRRPKKVGVKVAGSSSFPLKKWQCLAGWLNWSFNVYPHLCPCLNNIYHKIGGKERGEELIYVNNEIRADLVWAADHISKSDGVHLIRSFYWPLESACLTIYCDTSLTSMGFWLPDENVGYHSPIPPNFIPHNLPARDWILPYESLCVLSALQHAADNLLMIHESDSRIVIFTDSNNTVNIFSSMRCQPLYNPILRHATDILLTSRLQLRVIHVPGEMNIMADLLSRGQLMDALTVHPFEPPSVRLGWTGC